VRYIARPPDYEFSAARAVSIAPYIIYYISGENIFKVFLCNILGRLYPVYGSWGKVQFVIGKIAA
jgi:hypothetical protein